MIEVKCPFIVKVPHTKIPPVYYCQINGLMEILDKDWCDYVSWTPTEMKVYRIYRDRDLFDFLLDRYSTFYAYMQRGCDKVPRMTSTEKQLVLSRIADSDAHTRYEFWAKAEPGALAGCWDGPPDDPYLDCSDDSSEESPSSKRPREDVQHAADEVGCVPLTDPPTDHDSTGPRDLHTGPATDVHQQRGECTTSA